jgi:hypothetical protein
MAPLTHTAEQGIRVHYLANLGGLVAIAGLDHQPPDLLLGILLEVAARLPKLPEERQGLLRARGQARLEERAAAKRAWKAWARAEQLHRLDLRTAEVHRLIGALGGTVATPAQAVPTLLTMLRETAP